MKDKSEVNPDQIMDLVDAIGNVASEIDLLVVAEAQGAIVAHDAYRRLRGG